MYNRYLPALARFGLTVLTGGAALKLLVSRFPAEMTSRVGSYYTASLGSLVHDALLNTLTIGARALAIGLPLALVLGLASGLRPGSRLDRIMALPGALLAGLPALPAVLAIVCALTLDLRWLGSTPALHVALGAVTLPWLALAIRGALGPIAAEGAGVHPGRAITAILGAVLGQAGNLALASLTVGIYLVPDTGLLRLLELGSRLSDPIMLYTLLAPPVMLVALAHVLGDMIAAFAGAPGRPPGRLPWLWAAPGAVLLAAGLFAFLPYAAQTANTWLITLGATVVAVMGGCSLALLGPAVPRLGLPSLMAPVLVGLVAPVLTAPTFLVQMLAIGLGSAATMAPALRRLAVAEDEDHRPALLGAAGALLLTAGQALGAQVTLGVMNIGLPPELSSLGHLARTGLLSDPTGQQYGPVLFALATGAGLFLLGMALKERAGDPAVDGPSAEVPGEQVPVEPDQEQEGAAERTGTE